MKLEAFLSCLKRVRQDSQNHYMALCPAHEDHDRSLSITVQSDRLLISCFAGCNIKDIVRAMKLTEADLFFDNSRTHRTNTASRATAAPGVTVGQLAAANRLPPDFLQGLGVTDLQYCGGPAVRIPYHDEGGKEVAVHIRVAITGESRFRWRKGDRTLPYGLSRLATFRKCGWILIVEGETDCWTGWLHGIPTLGAPGKGTWRREWAKYLAGFEVWVWQEPDAEDFVMRVLESSPNLRFVRAPEGIKDIAEAHIQGLDIPVWLDDLKSRAESRQELEERLANRAGEAKRLPEGSISLVCMAEVEPETVAWLWWPYIPLGKLTLLEGDPGIGKSWVSLAIAAAVSLGKGLPGTEVAESAAVLLASAEDGLGDTIRPRLDAMKADIGRVHAIKGALDFGNDGLRTLEEYIERVIPALVIVDPLVAYIGAAVDIHRANETRAVMAKLADMAERHSVAILAIRHLTKGGTLKPIYRGLGSIDLAAACRSILMAGCDPEDPQKRGIVHIKSNLAPTGRAVGYELRDDGFFWTGDSDLTWQRILAAEDTGGKSALEEAMQFLGEELADGAVEVKEVEKDAEKAGINPRTLRRARESMGIRASRQGEPGRRGGGCWVWELPPGSDGQDDLDDHVDPIEKSGHLNQDSFAGPDPADRLGHVNQRPSDQGELPDQLGHLNDSGYSDNLPLLGLTPEEVTEVWRAEGSPPIPLSDCEVCHDLAKALSNHTVKEAHVQVITEWLRATLTAKREADVLGWAKGDRARLPGR